MRPLTLPPTPFLAVLVFGSAVATACGGDDIGSDTAYAQEHATPIHSSELSSNYVKPDTWYLGRRSIDLLVELGALSTTELTVARRADGIIGSMPSNGELGAKELADLESPDSWASLFPEEQQAIPKLWSLLELDLVTTYASPCTYPNWEGMVTLVDHGSHVAPPVLLPIGSLSPDLQATAKRVQLLHDSDGDSNTISSWDLVQANDNDQPYTPAEADRFQPILEAIEALMPPPDPALPRHLIADESCSGSVATGDVSTTVSGKSELEGQWMIDERYGPSGPRAWYQDRVQMTPSQGGDRLVTYDLKYGEEVAQEAGQGIERTPPYQPTIRGTRGFRVELWRAGARAQVFEFSFPDFVPSGERIPLFLPIELEATGEILYPSFDNARIVYGNVRDIEFASVPSEPAAWKGLSGNVSAWEYRRSGTLVLMASGQRQNTTVTTYPGGWAVLRVDGQVVVSLAPNFSRRHHDDEYGGHEPGGELIQLVSERRSNRLDRLRLLDHNPAEGWLLPNW